MNPILAAISNSVSAMPATTSVAQPASVQRLGGFASTLAAAQGFTTASLNAPGEVEASDGIAAENGRAAANVNVRTQGAGNPQLKKLLTSSPPVTVNTLGLVNVVLPGFIPLTVSQIPSRSSQPGLPQPSLLPALTAAVQVPTVQVQAVDLQSGRVQSREIAAGNAQAGMQTTAPVAAPPNTSAGYSELSQTAAGFGPSTGDDAAVGAIADLSKPGVLIADQVAGQANGQDTARTEVAQPLAMSAAVRGFAPGAALPSIAPGSEWNSSDGPTLRGPTLLAESTAPESSLPNISANTQSSGFQAHGSQSDGPGLRASESIPRAGQSVETTAPAPLLVASAILEAQPVGVLSSSAANLPSSQASGANAVAPDTAQSDPSTATGTGDSLFGMIHAQIAATPILNSPAQPGASLRFAAPRVTSAVTNPSVRGAGAPASTLRSVLPAESDSGNESPEASQTPFAIFFSGPGPGAEAAASVLPKMILPATSSAIRDSHASASNAAPASPQPSGFQSGVGQSAAPAINKASSSASDSTSLQVQPARRDADLNAASTQVAASQAVAGATPAPVSTAATLPLSGSAAPVNDAAPKPEALPAAASESPASPVRVAAEAPAAIVPGPVQVAQLVSRIGQSEMRIGMNTSAFGSVEVRTVVHANDVGLVIGSEKGDLRTLLANEMPAITNTLQQQNLRLNSVNFMQGFAFSNNASGGSDSQQRSFVPLRAPESSQVSEATVNDAMEPRPGGDFGGGRGRLSILA